MNNKSIESVPVAYGRESMPLGAPVVVETVFKNE
jgi:hypothetical protein